MHEEDNEGLKERFFQEHSWIVGCYLRLIGNKIDAIICMVASQEDRGKAPLEFEGIKVEIKIAGEIRALPKTKKPNNK